MRHKGLDLFKGFLTIQMIAAHCMQFFANLKPDTVPFYVSEYINLTTFSGFIFAFGYVSYHAYLTKPYKAVAARILLNSVRLLIAYYISGFAYYIFVDQGILNRTNILNILTFQNIPKWSEFLLSFSILMLLLFFTQPLIKMNLRFSPLIIAVISVASIYFSREIRQPILATILGRSEFSLFPVLPYSIYFAAGIFLAQNPKIAAWKQLLLSGLATVSFIVHFRFYGLPERFPPSLLWIIGSAVFINLYYLLSKLLLKYVSFSRLRDIGESSLFYLLLSNIFIFSVKSSRFFILNLQYALLFFVVTVLSVYFLSKLISKRKQAQ